MAAGGERVFNCTLCDQFSTPWFQQIVTHVGKLHAFDPNFRIRCGVDVCSMTYTNFFSYKSHVHRKHRAETGAETGAETTQTWHGEERSSDATAVDTSDREDLVLDQPSEQVGLLAFQEEPGGRAEDFKRSVAKFIMRTRDVKGVSQDDIVNGVEHLIEASLSEIRMKMTDTLDSTGCSEEAKEAVLGVFQNPSVFKPFGGLHSRYEQLNFIKENFNLVVRQCSCML